MNNQEDVNPNLRFRVTLEWYAGRSDIFSDVGGFSLDDDVYFFYTNMPEADNKVAMRTVWTKSPNLKSIIITPYIKES